MCVVLDGKTIGRKVGLDIGRVHYDFIRFCGTTGNDPAEGYAAGLGAWSAPGKVATTRTYQLAWSLPTTAPLSAEGGTAAVSFVWEAQTR